MKTKVDLRRLAVERTEAPIAWRPRWRALVARVVLPGMLLACFGALLLFAAWDWLFPPRAVTVVPAIALESSFDRQADTPLFRAAGWVEPRPSPTLVTALAEGVVDKLLVVEGQEVREGDVVARLIDADAKIALDAALADVKLREAELSAARAAVVAAKARLDGPLHLRIELADATAALAKSETELANLAVLLRAAQARQRYARDEFKVHNAVGGTVSELAIRKSKSDMETADALVEELEGRGKRLPIEVAALKDKRDALAEKLRLKTDEVRQLGEATAAEESAKARLSQAKSAADAATLRLTRMEVRAPMSGRVLAVVAKPGARLMGQDPRSFHESSSVVSLYDPASLQVRVDVRLEDVGKALSGQKVVIECAALEGKRLDGVVLAATSQADVQKNTLAVKVGVKDPPPNLKPDMLCQVVFLSPPRIDAPGKKDGGGYRLFAPRQLVEATGDGGRVWIVDLASGRAVSKTVRLGSQVGDLVEVVSGLTPTDRLVVGGREGLRNGDRVRIAGEDDVLGIANQVDKK